MAEHQILRARRRPDRIRLHEPEEVERALQCGRRDETACDGETAEVGEGERHE